MIEKLSVAEQWSRALSAADAARPPLVYLFSASGGSKCGVARVSDNACAEIHVGDDGVTLTPHAARQLAEWLTKNYGEPPEPDPVARPSRDNEPF